MRGHLSIVLAASTIALSGCERITPPFTGDTTVVALSLEIVSPPTVIAYPGEGRANLDVISDSPSAREEVTPAVTVTGPFTASWESLRWQLRTLRITSTGVGSGKVTVSLYGKSVSFDVHSEAVAFKRIAMSSWSAAPQSNPNGCGIALDDRVWCWGGNDTYQLGAETPRRCSGGACQYGGIYPSASPMRVAVSQTFSQVDATTYSCPAFIDRTCGASCALTTGGEAWCWGEGFGPPTRAAPSVSFASLALGGRFPLRTCGIATDARAYCFTSSTLTPVGDGMSFKWLAVGGSSTCGVVTAGDVWCWGANYYGVLGIGNSDGKAYTAAQRVTTTGTFVSVDPGYYLNCALDTAGTIHCWGLGFSTDGTAPPPPCEGSATSLCQTVPRAVQGGRAYVAVATAGSSVGVCGLTSSGGVDCWASFNKPPVTIALPEPITTMTRSCGVSAANVMYCWSPTGTFVRVRG
ncbi:MAG TPA: hypothetical protein VFO55_11575 [Gemmatimonadaceae bacterium]|nr:hypothetical protein [Gemmatimonadaceae bacterium]